METVEERERRLQMEHERRRSRRLDESAMGREGRLAHGCEQERQR